MIISELSVCVYVYVCVQAEVNAAFFLGTCGRGYSLPPRQFPGEQFAERNKLGAAFRKLAFSGANFQGAILGGGGVSEAVFRGEIFWGIFVELFRYMLIFISGSILKHSNFNITPNTSNFFGIIWIF